MTAANIGASNGIIHAINAMLVTEADLEGTNGVVQIIDGVLLFDKEFMTSTK